MAANLFVHIQTTVDCSNDDISIYRPKVFLIPNSKLLMRMDFYVCAKTNLILTNQVNRAVLCQNPQWRCLSCIHCKIVFAKPCLRQTRTVAPNQTGVCQRKSIPIAPPAIWELIRTRPLFITIIKQSITKNWLQPVCNGNQQKLGG